MFVVQTILHFSCAFSIYLFFLMITCCVRVGGSSTLGSGTGSGLWGLVPGVTLALQDWGFNAMVMMWTPLFIRVGKVPATASQELLSVVSPTPVVDDLSHVLNHIHSRAKV